MLSEDASGSDTEKATMSPRERRAAKVARLEHQKVQEVIKRSLKDEKMRSRSGNRVSVDVNAKDSVQKITAELQKITAEIDATKKKADTMLRNVELKKEVEAMFSKTKTVKQKKANKIARTLEPGRKAEEEKIQEKRRNPEVKTRATTFENIPKVPGILFSCHTTGFASPSRGSGRVSAEPGTSGKLFDFTKLSQAMNHKGGADAHLLQERKRLSFPRWGGVASPPVPEIEERDVKRIFAKVDGGFWEILTSASQLAAEQYCSRRVRLTCDDIKAAVTIWIMELVPLQHQYRLVHRLNQELIRCSRMSGVHLVGYRQAENSMIGPVDRWKDVEEEDVEPSARILGRRGVLKICPTSKLGSSWSATGSPSIDVSALIDRTEYTSMVYQIPEEVKREAMLASSSTGAAYWQYSLYQEGGDTSGDKVKVHYCTSKETTERIAQLFLDKEVIGFDIEWRPQAQIGEGIKKNVSLIQLASEERIALFHIARYGKGDTIDDLLAPSLKKIMESSEISKVGVSVKADCTRLRRFLGIEARGLFELSHLYKLIKHFDGDVRKINKMLVSLAQQVEEHLQLPMWKGEVRSSDWSQKLNYEQIKYAASDSYAGLRLYDVMEGKRKTLEPAPPRPAHAELNLPIVLANGKTVATYDEPDELKDENPTEDGSAHPADLEEMARDFQDIELEDSEIKPSTTSNSAARGSKRSLEITAAESWVIDWRSQRPPGYKARAMPSQLRAYAVWNELGKEVSEVAGILRDPPLQVTTVARYILEAIRLEKLPFQEHRLARVWELLPARSPARGWRPQGGK